MAAEGADETFQPSCGAESDNRLRRLALLSARMLSGVAASSGTILAFVPAVIFSRSSLVVPLSRVHSWSDAPSDRR